MPQQIAEIPFGSWLPDKADYKNPGCLVADNCYPSPGDYAPFPGGNPQGSTINEVVRGARQIFRENADSLIIGGTDTKLFVLVSGTLTATTGYSSIGDLNYWQFAQFNDKAFATAPGNAVQYLSDIESDVTWSAAPGSPPQAATMGRVGNFLMVGNLTGLNLPYSIQWAAENDPTDWPTPGTNDARLKQSGRAALQPEYGTITRIAGDRYPLVFQQRGISRVTPEGPPTVFRIQTIEEARGCIAPLSAVTVGFITYFLAHDGFYATDGNSVQAVGTRKVNEFFFNDVSESDRFRTHGAINWEEQCVVWTYYPADNATGFRRQIIYSWQENRWSTAQLHVYRLVDNKIGGTTLEELDALFLSGLESVDPNLDSPEWFAKSRVLSAFMPDGSGNSELNLFNGSSLEATFETADNEPKPGYRVAVNAIYPVVENESANTEAALLTRESKGAVPVATTQRAVNSAGFCPVTGDGRYVRARVVIPAAASWDKAQGVQIEHRVSGKR